MRLLRDVDLGLSTIVFALPASRLKNKVLNLLGNKIAMSAYIGPNLALGKLNLTAGDKSIIRFGNVFRNLRSVELGPGAQIGQWNWFSSIPEIWQRDDFYGRLSVGEESHILSRHVFDCSGGIKIGVFSTIAGYRSVFMTHGIDVSTARQTYGSIVIGDRCLVGGCNGFVKGAVLPDRCVTALGCVVPSGLVRSDVLYGGVPARRIRDLTINEFSRRLSGTVET